MSEVEWVEWIGGAVILGTVLLYVGARAMLRRLHNRGPMRKAAVMVVQDGELAGTVVAVSADGTPDVCFRLVGVNDVPLTPDMILIPPADPPSSSEL